MMSGWGYSESPLIDGDKLICTPGGKDATLVALNKKTGEVIWKAPVPGGDGAGVRLGDRRRVRRPAAVRAVPRQRRGRRRGRDGKFLWRYDHPANGTANAATPIYHDGHVFATSAYNAGGGLVKLTKDDNGAVKAEEVWFTDKQMQNHHGGVILLDGYLYGANGGNEGGYLTCLDFKTGKVMWDERDKPDRKGVRRARSPWPTAASTTARRTAR